MERQDDRFDFPKFELPNAWLTFTKGGGGTFKGADGKMKLAPGHSLASKFPDKVASSAEMKARETKMGEKAGSRKTELADPLSLPRSTSLSDSELKSLQSLSGSDPRVGRLLDAANKRALRANRPPRKETIMDTASMLRQEGVSEADAKATVRKINESLGVNSDNHLYALDLKLYNYYKKAEAAPIPGRNLTGAQKQELARQLKT